MNYFCDVGIFIAPYFVAFALCHDFSEDWMECNRSSRHVTSTQHFYVSSLGVKCRKGGGSQRICKQIYRAPVHCSPLNMARCSCTHQSNVRTRSSFWCAPRFPHGQGIHCPLHAAPNAWLNAKKQAANRQDNLKYEMQSILQYTGVRASMKYNNCSFKDLLVAEEYRATLNFISIPVKGLFNQTLTVCLKFKIVMFLFPLLWFEMPFLFMRAWVLSITKLDKRIWHHKVWWLLMVYLLLITRWGWKLIDERVSFCFVWFFTYSLIT